MGDAGVGRQPMADGKRRNNTLRPSVNEEACTSLRENLFMAPQQNCT